MCARSLGDILEPLSLLFKDRQHVNRDGHGRPAEDAPLLPAIVAVLPDMLFTLKRDGTFTGAWMSGESDIFGSPSALTGRNIADVLPPYLATLTLYHIRLALETGRLQEYECDLTVRGAPRFLACRITASGQDEALALVRNVTGRKSAAQAENEQRALAEALSDSLRALTSTLSTNEVLGQILQSIVRVVPHDAATIMRIDGDTARVVRHRGHRAFGKDDWLSDLRFNLATVKGLASMVASRQPLLIADTAAYADWLPAAGSEWIRSYIGAPICIKGNVIGFLNLDSSTPGFFKPEHLTGLRAFADQAAVALHHAETFEQLQRRLRESVLLNHVIAAATSVLDVDAVMQTILEEMAQAFAMPRACAVFLSDDLTRVRVMATHPPGEAADLIGVELPLTASHDLPSVFALRRPVACTDAATDPTLAPFVDLLGQHGVASLLAVPLDIRDHPKGFLILISNERRQFDPDQLALAQIVAAATSQALENAQLYAKTLQRAGQFAALHDVTNDLAAQSDLSGILDTIVERTMAILAAPAALMLLYDPAQDDLFVAIKRGLTEPLPERIRLGETALGRAGQTRQAIIQNVTAALASGTGVLDEASVVAVPMTRRDNLLGVLAAVAPRPARRSFSDAEARLLSLFAGLAANAVDVGRFMDESKRRIRELEAVNRLSASLRAAQSLDEMLPLLLDETLAALETDAGAVVLHDPPSGMLYNRMARGWATSLPDSAWRADQGVAGGVFRSGQAYVSDDIAADPQARADARLLVPAGWSGAWAPIRTSSEIIGVFFVARRGPQMFPPNAVALLSTIAEIAGNAIYRTRLHEETVRNLQRLAALHTVDTAMNSSRDLTIVLDVILSQVVDQLGVDMASILMLDPLSQSLDYAVSRGALPQPHRGTRVHLTQSTAGHIAVSRQTFGVPDMRLDAAEPVRLPPTLARQGIVGYLGVPLIAKGMVRGVLEIAHRSPLALDSEALGFCETLAAQAAMAIADAAMFSELTRSNADLTLAYDATIEGWSRALSLRDRETETHTQRVTDLTLRLAQAMNVPYEELVHIRRGALLHDIGKMAIPDSILLKPGPLTEDEWVIMRRHPLHAHDLLSRIFYLQSAVAIPQCHHEHWDGTGYPQGLQGDAIPLAARIFAVVDVWDGLTSARPYHSPYSDGEAVAYLLAQAGKQFDPAVLQVFIEHVLPQIAQ